MNSDQMNNDQAPATKNSYQFCTVQLNLFSLMMLTGLSGLCGGIAWSVILIVADWQGIIALEKFDGPLEVFIGFSFVGAFGSALFALVGYPIYNWVCKSIRGQNLRGTFYDPRP